MSRVILLLFFFLNISNHSLAKVIDLSCEGIRSVSPKLDVNPEFSDLRHLRIDTNDKIIHEMTDGDPSEWTARWFIKIMNNEYFFSERYEDMDERNYLPTYVNSILNRFTGEYSVQYIVDGMRLFYKCKPTNQLF